MNENLSRTATADLLASPRPRVRLGEELPVFCEKCGYSLHGAVQVRCQHCDILQFHCPECGHHQPINTLRPAAQRILGKLRAAALAWAVFWRLNFFAWLLFGWGVLGSEASYRYDYERYYRSQSTTAGVPMTSPQFVPRPFDIYVTLTFCLLALPFGMVGRMLLLRWRRNLIVGCSLAMLVAAAVLLGAKFAQFDRRAQLSPYSQDFLFNTGLTIAMVLLGTLIVWPIWSGLVRLFLPPRLAESLLAWQRWESDAAELARH